MDTEQLRLVLEMLGSATDSALWVAVLWLAKGIFESLLTAGFFAWAIAFVVRYGAALIRENSLAHRLRADNPLCPRKYGSLTVSETESIVETHRRGVEAGKAGKC